MERCDEVSNDALPNHVHVYEKDGLAGLEGFTERRVKMMTLPLR